MDPYERLIEGLTQLPAGDPARGSGRAIRDAVSRLPWADPPQAAHAVERWLDTLLAQTWHGGQRIGVLGHLCQPVADLCAGFERELGIRFHPLPVAMAERAALAQRLEWKLARNAAKGLHELCAPTGRLPLFKSTLAVAALVAALVHASEALLWGYRQYQPSSANTWRLIHALYRFADERGVANRSGGGAMAVGGRCSARTAYVAALALAMGTPYRFSARELTDAAIAVRCLADRCTWIRARAASGDNDRPGPRSTTGARLAAGADAPVLDLESMARACDERIASLPAGTDLLSLPWPGGGVRTVGVGAVRRLQSGWANGDRGYPRLAAGYALEVAVGMHALHYALAGQTGFADFVRAVRGEAAAAGRRGSGSAWLDASDGTVPQTVRADVLDQSRGGYRLCVSVASGVRLRVGELVGVALAIDEEGDRGWMVGVIRWFKLEGGRGWLGVELLHRTARAAGVRPIGAGRAWEMPQRAVELPGEVGANRLVLLMGRPLGRDVRVAEVVLPNLVSDWRTHAACGVWHFAEAAALANACVRVTLERRGRTDAA